MKMLTLEQHRARIDNLNRAEQNNRAYLRRIRIRDYNPGQNVYNLGDYPKKFSIEPTEYDYNMLKSLADSGVEVIQLHEEWNDSIRHLGADKFSSFDPQGLHHFVDLCHSFGMKIIPYISTGYFHVYDPDFTEKFARSDYYCCIGMYFKYRKCWAGSPEWRSYLLPRTFAALDEYGFDGIYNDWGYDGCDLAYQAALDKGITDYAPLSAPMPYDPELEDLLGTIYSEVKKRGGIYKLHCDHNNPPPCKDRVYDYLWIGECVEDAEIGVGKDFQPYVVPSQDMQYSKVTDPDTYYASVIPFVQFPILKRGRPLRGERIDQPVTYYPSTLHVNEYDFNRRVRDYMKEHPDGPYVYSLWSAIPDDVEEHPRWARYMSLYKPMVEENSVAYVEIRDCKDILSPLPKEVIASMFVNEETYLVVSNLQADKPYRLVLETPWTNRETGESSKEWTIPAGRMVFLRRD